MTQPEELTLEIFPTEGGYQGMRASRSYRIVLEGMLPPERVLLEGAEIPWRYDGDALRVTIPVPEQPVREAVRLQVLWRSGILRADSLTTGFRGALAGLRRIVPRLNRYWPREWSPPSVVHALQTGTRITLRPESASTELEAFWMELERVRADIRRMRIPESEQVQILQHLDRIP